MSYNRISRPGHATILIDEGPSPAGFVRGYGGTMVQGADTPAKPRTLNSTSCGGPTPSGPCVRWANHADDCRSRIAQDQRNATARRRERGRKRIRKRPSRAYVPKCGVMMKLAQKPCARRAGHKDNHLDRLALDHQIERNRARRPIAA